MRSLQVNFNTLQMHELVCWDLLILVDGNADDDRINKIRYRYEQYDVPIADLYEIIFGGL